MTPQEVRNEHARHMASWLNTLAAGIVAAGTFVPAAQLIFRLLPAETDDGLVFGLGAVCVAAGVILHLVGHLVLGQFLR